MGTIKDLVDLTVQLSERVKDRKLAGELREVQRMVGTLASENAGLQESRIELMTENADLKKQMASLQARIGELERECATLKSPQPVEAPKFKPYECKFCGQKAAKLAKVASASHFIHAELGIKSNYYECTKCGQKWEIENL